MPLSTVTFSLDTNDLWHPPTQKYHTEKPLDYSLNANLISDSYMTIGIYHDQEQNNWDLKSSL